MYIVTISRASGSEIKHLVEGPRLKSFLALAVGVLLSGESLSYCHA